MEKFSVVSLASQIQTEGDAYAFLEKLRWGAEPVCPHCGVIGGHYFLKPSNGVSRTTSRGTQSQRRTWKCADCRKQFSVTTKTVMHGSHVPLRVWVLVFFEMAANKNGISAREIERKYGVNARTAWHLTQRIREAMRSDGKPFTGTVVVADETWVGGEPRNMHASKRPARGKGYSDQTPVLSLVSIGLETKEVRSQVVPDVRGVTLRKAIGNEAVLPEITLFTDSAMAYRELAPKVARHVMVNHKAGEYVKRGAGTGLLHDPVTSELWCREALLEGCPHAETPSEGVP
jgi:transposase-like protein